MVSVGMVHYFFDFQSASSYWKPTVEVISWMGALHYLYYLKSRSKNMYGDTPIFLFEGLSTLMLSFRKVNWNIFSV